MPAVHPRRIRVGLVACLALAAAAAPRASHLPVPFEGTFTGQLVLLPPFSEGSVDRCNANLTEAGESPGFFLTLVDHAVGQFTHLGRTEIDSTSCLSPDSPLNVQGQGVLRAANGDTILITFQNITLPTDDPDLLEVTGTESIVGGTGRFAGAIGDQTCAFVVRLSTGIIEGGCIGGIVY
jgi:hypothetical protein